MEVRERRVSLAGAAIPRELELLLIAISETIITFALERPQADIIDFQ